jgi:hypothetical protein
MPDCPRCGCPLKEGTTRCWNSECVDADRIDWQSITDRAVAINQHLRRRDQHVDLFTVLPPIDSKQIAHFNSKAGYKLPTDFVQFLTKYAGGWRFSWSLYELKEKGHDQPEWSPGSTGGNSEGARPGFLYVVVE